MREMNERAVAGAVAPASDTNESSLPSSLIFLLASAAGLAVASLYYSQPILGVLGADMNAAAGLVGLVPTLTQLGYALGILFLAPLGDRYDRRRIIAIKAALLTLALLSAGSAPSIQVLLAASLAIGLSATLAQDVVPTAATLAPAVQRGRVVGTVMTGLLLGILLSRVASGFVAERFGWRTVFFCAALSIVAIGIAAWRRLPACRPATGLSYAALMRSLLALWREHASLRRAAVAQGLLSAAFSAFWSTLALMLHAAPFHLGSAVAGAFGLAGAAGALAAPLAGHLADRRGPEFVTRVGAGLTAASFALLCFGPALTPALQLWLLGLGAVGFDLGVQASLVAHQSIIYRIDPAARSRLNAVLFVGVFSGMAGGSVLGSLLLQHWGWQAVMLMAVAASLAALAVRLRPALPAVALA